jgi:pimeloyl-ACP methyl ester carboxylesterase
MPGYGFLRRGVRWMLIASAVLVTLSVLLIAGLRLLIANGLRIEGPAAIQESGYVSIGRQQQWIELRGWNRANPVLLWVHGGPGAPVISASYSSFLPWEHQFTVVHWHQRGAGLTYAANAPGRLRIDTMVTDGIQVVEYVRSRLPDVPIIVVGHSWGSVLAMRMVQRRPELFAAYVGTGQFTSLDDDGRDLFAAALGRARRDSNERGVRALDAVAALPVADVHRMDVVREWGRTEAVSDNPLLVYVGLLLSPGYPVQRVFSFTRGFAKSRADLFEEEQRVNMLRDVPELKVPAFLFQGRDDWQVSTPSALRYFEALKAPAKDVVLFDGGHMVAMLQSEAFLKALVEKVRPVVVGTTDDRRHSYVQVLRSRSGTVLALMTMLECPQGHERRSQQTTLHRSRLPPHGGRGHPVH